MQLDTGELAAVPTETTSCTHRNGKRRCARGLWSVRLDVDEKDMAQVVPSSIAALEMGRAGLNCDITRKSGTNLIFLSYYRRWLKTRLCWPCRDGLFCITGAFQWTMVQGCAPALCVGHWHDHGHVNKYSTAEDICKGQNVWVVGFPLVWVGEGVHVRTVVENFFSCQIMMVPSPSVFKY